VNVQSIDELTRSSSLVFTGTVVESAASNVPAVEPRDDLVLVRVERGLRVDPALGDVTGRVVTLETQSPGELQPGATAVFFTDSWIQGDELAVRENAHLPAEQADEVAAAVARLPDLHLADRLAAATAVVHAEVTSTRNVPGLPLERRAPRWAEADLSILETLKGDAAGARLLFPTTDSHHWYLAPSFTAGQRGVFLLHADDPQVGHWLDAIQDGAIVTALDPADAQPESALEHVRSLLAGGGA
jgi:hypothetical protein